MALTGANTDIRFNSPTQALPRSVVVKAGQTIYKNGFCVSDVTTGEAKIPDSTLNDLPLGFAQEEYAAGETATFVYNHVARVPISGITIADIGKIVYASSDNVFTLTSTNNQAVGRLDYIDPAGGAIAYVRADLGR